MQRTPARTGLVGFIGIGLMGGPIALNLARGGVPLLVWNRTPGKDWPLRAAGARVADTVDEVFHESSTVLLMLTDEVSVDEVLGRRAAGFVRTVAGRTIVHMGTTSARYSADLAADVRAAGGAYVEAPVSGSRQPAEEGELVVMLAGEEESSDEVASLLRPAARRIIRCGAVPSASHMKLAVNLFLISMVTALAEAHHFAEEHGLDLDAFREILNEGPMASAASRAKLHKLEHDDFSPHASITDVLKNTELIERAARDAHIASPLLDQCRSLFVEAHGRGDGDEDMVAVVQALRTRTHLLRPGSSEGEQARG